MAGRTTTLAWFSYRAATGLGFALVQGTGFVFEVPTGVVSDLVSRKLSLLLAALFRTLSYLLLTLSLTPLVMFGGFMAFGVATAFTSGTLAAWLHDTLEQQSRLDDFKRLVGVGATVQLSALTIGTVLSGPLVALFGIVAPMVAAVAFAAISALAAVCLREPGQLQKLRPASAADTLQDRTARFLVHTRESMGYVFRTPALRSLVFLQLVVARFVNLPRNLFTQPYFRSFGWVPAQVAFIFVVFSAVQAAFSGLAAPISRLVRSDELRSLWLLALVGVVSLLLLGNAGSAAVLVMAYVLLSVVGGLLIPFREQAVHSRAPTEKRAAVASTVGMGFQATGFVFVPAFGRLADVYSTRTSITIFHLVFIALLAVAVVWCSRTLGSPRRGSESDPPTAD